VLLVAAGMITETRVERGTSPRPRQRGILQNRKNPKSQKTACCSARKTPNATASTAATVRRTAPPAARPTVDGSPRHYPQSTYRPWMQDNPGKPTGQRRGRPRHGRPRSFLPGGARPHPLRAEKKTWPARHAFRRAAQPVGEVAGRPGQRAAAFSSRLPSRSRDPYFAPSNQYRNPSGDLAWNWPGSKQLR